MTLLNAELYRRFDAYAPFLVSWTALFTVVTSTRIALMSSRGASTLKHSSVLTELAALPLAILQSVFFVRAVASGDVVSAALFVWWGPGFVATAAYIGICAYRHVKPDFRRLSLSISWACKLNYLAFAIVFALLRLPALLFVYSAWIINDQYGLAYLSLDADRLRRTFHDYWIVRVLYPAGLLTPIFFHDMPHRGAYAAYGALLLVLWASGIAYVRRRSDVMRVPDDPTLLRNLVYFSKADP